MKNMDIIFVEKVSANTDVSAQTGDTLITIIGILLILASAIFLIAYRSNFWKFTRGNHCAVINLSSNKILTCVSAIVMIVGLSLTIFGISPHAFAAADVNYTIPGQINAYVDKENKEVTFDRGFIQNDEDYQITLENLSVLKLEGIDDKDCTWTIKAKDKVLYNDVATDVNKSKTKLLDIQANEKVDIEVNSNIDFDVAVSLIGKSVVSIKYDISGMGTLNWDDDSNIKIVKDKKGNIIQNGQKVASGTKIFVKAEVSGETLNYKLNVEEDGLEPKPVEVPKGTDAVFYMGEGGTFISAKESTKEFYAVRKKVDLDSERSDLYFYYTEKKQHEFLNDEDVYDQPSIPFKNPSKAEDWPWGDDRVRQFVLNVNFDESLSDFYGFESTAYMFYSFRRCISYNDCKFLKTSNVKNMSYMFENLYSNNDYLVCKDLDLSSWDTSSVKDMNHMFMRMGQRNEKKDYLLNKVPDVSTWDMSSVEDISYMFAGDFDGENNQIDNVVPDVSRWDTSSVKDMSHCFDSYGFFMNQKIKNEFNCVPDVSKWNTSSVENMECVFQRFGGCSTQLNKVPDVSQWDTSAVSNMSYMFAWYDELSLWIEKEEVESDITLDLSSFNTAACASKGNYEHMLDSMMGVKHIVIGKNWNLKLTTCGIGGTCSAWTINSDSKEISADNLDVIIETWAGEWPITLHAVQGDTLEEMIPTETNTQPKDNPVQII